MLLMAHKTQARVDFHLNLVLARNVTIYTNALPPKQTQLIPFFGNVVIILLDYLINFVDQTLVI